MVPIVVSRGLLFSASFSSTDQGGGKRRTAIFEGFVLAIQPIFSTASVSSKMEKTKRRTHHANPSKNCYRSQLYRGHRNRIDRCRSGARRLPATARIPTTTTIGTTRAITDTTAAEDGHVRGVGLFRGASVGPISMVRGTSMEGRTKTGDIDNVCGGRFCGLL